MNITVVGVDPAAAKGKRITAVVLSEDGYQIHTLKITAEEMPERCLAAFRWMRSVVSEIDGPTMMYLEDLVYAPKKGGIRSLLPLAHIRGVLAAGALSGGATVVDVTPPQWKKSVIGNGSANKLKIKLHLKKYWQAFYLESEGDVDICDAGAIALYGRKRAMSSQGVVRAKRVGGGIRSRSPSSVPGGRVVGGAPGKGVPALVKNSKSK